MVNYNPRSWWGLIFKFHKSDTFRQLLPAMLSIALFAGGVVYVDLQLLPPALLKGTTVLHSLLGLVISLLLVFRTNTAYERWWEGRRLWGALVNSSRALALKLNAFLPDDHASRAEVAELLALHAEVLKDHLRGKRPKHFAATLQHGPNQVQSRLLEQVQRLYRSGELSDAQLLCLNGDLTAFSDICGGCERIQKTPIPYSYSLFLKKFIFAYVVSMPFCFAAEFHYWTIALTVFIFYVLASLELIAEEIENPFGTDANDLPTDNIALAIRHNIHELLVKPLV